MTFADLSLSKKIKRCEEFSAPYRVTKGSSFRLKDVNPGDTGDLEAEDKPRAKEVLALGVETLSELQERLYADDRWSLLLVLQAMDAAGKDGTIKHVMSGVNPQGCEVSSFKVPSAEDLDHDYLWRYVQRLPQRGRIGIFNRSYYEEVLVVRVHKEVLARCLRRSSPNRSGRRGTKIFAISSACSSAMATSFASSSCTCPERNRKSGFCNDWRYPPRTGSFPPPTSKSGVTGTIMRKPTRT